MIGLEKFWSPRRECVQPAFTKGYSHNPCTVHHLLTVIGVHPPTHVIMLLFFFEGREAENHGICRFEALKFFDFDACEILAAGGSEDEGHKSRGIETL